GEQALCESRVRSRELVDKTSVDAGETFSLVEVVEGKTEVEEACRHGGKGCADTRLRAWASVRRDSARAPTHCANPLFYVHRDGEGSSVAICLEQDRSSEEGPLTL